MSGIEIAGLVLGSLPILFEALDNYKKGGNRIKSGFRKRESVKKLARALRMQTQILDALIKDVLLHSGCILPPDETQLYLFIQRKSTRDDVDDFLGAGNAQVLAEALDDCLTSVQSAAARIASLVPSVKKNAKIQEVLDANQAAKHGEVDFIARFTLVMSISDLEGDIAALDRSSNTLERFANRVISNACAVQSTPSRKAMKLAKSLRAVRQRADSLHHAITSYWSRSCHTKHDLKLFLNDRIEQSNQRPPSDRSKSLFDAILSSHVNEQCVWWHDTVIHVANDDDDETLKVSQLSRVRIVMSPPVQIAMPNNVVTDLCSVIGVATRRKSQATLHLLKDQKLAVRFEPLSSDKIYRQTSSVTLGSILGNANTRRQPLPWKSRMILTLKLASSFLQFIYTPWMQTSWSADQIHFLLKDSNAQQVDLKQPYIFHEFIQRPSTPMQRQAQVRDDLINLGILLLEIWHSTTFETRFPSLQTQSHPSVPSPDGSTIPITTSTPSAAAIHTRHVYALQWLSDVEDPLPDLYNKAVSHCIVGIMVMGQVSACRWDDMEMWKAVCENIVEPLSKLSQI